MSVATMSSKGLASAVVGAALCVAMAARLYWPSAALTVAAPPLTTVVRNAVEPPPATTLRAPAAVREREPEDRGAGKLRMPDGSLLPPLNSALDPPPLVWPQKTPFSPVVGTLRNADGTDWYVHADGSRSTTMVDRDRDGRARAWTILANPMPTLPLDPR